MPPSHPPSPSQVFRIHLGAREFQRTPGPDHQLIQLVIIQFAYPRYLARFLLCWGYGQNFFLL